MKKATHIHGVMMVRNEWDLIAFNILYHLSLGLEQIHVVDNGSTDGTLALLETMSQSLPIWVTSLPGPNEQKKNTNQLVRQARQAGANWIVPIDADEFWDPGHLSIQEIVDSCGDEENGKRVPVVNHFVSASEKIARAGCALQGRWIAVEPFGSSAEIHHRANEGIIPVSLLEPGMKCFLRADRDLVLDTGAHCWENMPPETQISSDLLIRHLPHRHFGKVKDRVEAGIRARDTPGYVPGHNWHLIRLIAMNEEQLAGEWIASSVQQGALSHGKDSYPMKRDNSLRNLLLPQVSAAKKIYRQAGIDPKIGWFEPFW